MEKKTTFLHQTQTGTLVLLVCISNDIYTHIPYGVVKQNFLVSLKYAYEAFLRLIYALNWCFLKESQHAHFSFLYLTGTALYQSMTLYDWLRSRLFGVIKHVSVTMQISWLISNYDCLEDISIILAALLISSTILYFCVYFDTGTSAFLCSGTNPTLLDLYPPRYCRGSPSTIWD